MLTEIIYLMKDIVTKLGLQKEMFNIEDFCSYTGFSKDYAYKLTSKGSIRFYRPSGKQIFFDVEDVVAFLKQNPVKPSKDLDQESSAYNTKQKSR